MADDSFAQDYIDKLQNFGELANEGHKSCMIIWIEVRNDQNMGDNNG